MRISRNGNFKKIKGREANSTIQLEVKETLNHDISFKKSAVCIESTIGVKENDAIFDIK